MIDVDQLPDSVLDAVADALTDTTQNRSTIARKAKVDYLVTCAVLDWLVAHHQAVAEGNGNWTRYRAWRAFTDTHLVHTNR